MDQALKQRMVGATVLIALGVIFLPIFIGGSNDPEVAIEDDEFLIPPQPQIANNNNEPGRRLPLVRPSPVAPATDDNAAAVDLSSGEIRLPLPDESMPQENIANTEPDDNRVTTPPESTERIVSSDNDDANTEVPEATAENAVDTPPETQTVAVIAPPPINEDPSPPVNTSDGNAPVNLDNRWRVQVASLGNPDNATRLISQIESLGFPAQSQIITSNGNTLHRVLAGPFFNEAEANVAVTGIRRADDRLNPQVLRPENASQSNADSDSTTVVTNVATGLDRYAVQTGVFSSADNAQALVERLNNAGYAAYSERVDSNDQSVFRVRVGPLLSESDAGNIAARIERDLGVQGIVVDYPR